MRGPLISLCFVSLSLAWLVFFGAGTRLADWNATVLFLGAISLFYWMFRSGQTPPRLPWWQTLSLAALPAYAAFQLIPLPMALLEFLSPARATITQSLGGIISQLTMAPISVAPAASLFAFFSLLAYLTTFSLLRDMAWRFVESSPWIPTAPLIGIAAIEASIGISQRLAGSPATPVRGTFSSGEYFAGLLEITLPFTLVFGFISFRRHQRQTSPSLQPALLAAIAWGASLLFLISLYYSSSDASPMAVNSSIFILLVLAIVPRLKTKKLRWYGAGGAAALAIMIFLVAIPPTDFAESAAKLAVGNKPEATLAIWDSSAGLLADFRWFGTGLGGFASTFLKYQGSAGLERIETPGSDLLSLLISFGGVGFTIVLVAIASILWPAITGALYHADEPRRLLAVSATASICSAIIRCCVDSSLAAPGLAMTFAWVAGLSLASAL